ncbi:MAG: hypothetical protein JWO15_2657 [Sphingomonadales bacterium]|nr:hypothetical protein [Sphingomonadales bacterium]
MEKTHETPYVCRRPDDGHCSGCTDRSPTPGRCRRNNRACRSGSATASRFEHRSTGSASSPRCHDGSTTSGSTGTIRTHGSTRCARPAGKLSTLFGNGHGYVYAGWRQEWQIGAPSQTQIIGSPRVLRRPASQPGAVFVGASGVDL